jgi:hypothetical protein
VSEILWLKLEVTAKEKDTNASVPLVFSNRMITSVESYAILKPELSVDITMGEFLPNDSAGSLILQGQEQSFGFQRRFLDILERYTLINQKLVLSSGYSTLLVEPTVWRVDLKARIQDISYDTDTGDITINYYTRAFRNERLGVPVYPGAQFADPLVESIGQTIPAIIGYSPILPADGVSTSLQDATCIRVEKNDNKWLFGAFKDSDTANESYPFNFDDTSPVGAAWGDSFTTPRFQVLMPNSAGVYVPIDGRSPNSNGLVNTNSAPLGTGLSIFAWEWATPVILSSTIGGALPKYVTVNMTGTNNGSYTAGTSTTTLRLYEVDSNYAVIAVLASVTFQNIDYETQLQAAGNVPFDMTGIFTEWPILEPSKSYLWGLSFQGDVSEAVFYERAPIGTEIALLRNKEETNAPFTLPTGAGSDYNISVEVRQPAFTLTNIDLAALPSGKWGVAQLELAEPGTQAERDIFGIAPTPIIRVIGPNTSVSGELDTTIGDFIQGPYQMLRYLDLQYSGGVWVPDQFDSSPIPTTGSGRQSAWPSPYRSLIYVSPDGATVREAAEEICRQGACRVALRPDAAGDALLSFEQWGEDREPESVPFTDELGVEVLSLQIRGLDSVVNLPRLFIGQRLSAAGTSRAAVAQGVYDAAALVVAGGDLSYEATQLRNKSTAVYGRASLRDERFPYLADEESAAAMVEFYLRELSQPSIYVIIKAPHRTYGFIHCLDIVEITHPALPAFFGTAAESTLPTFEDEPVDPNYGHPLKRARMYRGQVEGRRMVVSDENPPYVEFIIRIKQ